MFDEGCRRVVQSSAGMTIETAGVLGFGARGAVHLLIAGQSPMQVAISIDVSALPYFSAMTWYSLGGSFTLASCEAENRCMFNFLVLLFCLEPTICRFLEGMGFKDVRSC
jgi:hypothetical protein